MNSEDINQFLDGEFDNDVSVKPKKKCKECGGKMIRGWLYDKTTEHAIVMRIFPTPDGGFRWMPSKSRARDLYPDEEFQMIGYACEKCRHMEFYAENIK